MAASSRGSLIATGGIDGRVMLWDAKTGQRRQTLVGHKSCVNSLTFSPDGKRLISGSSEGQLLETLQASGAEAFL